MVIVGRSPNTMEPPGSDQPIEGVAGANPAIGSPFGLAAPSAIAPQPLLAPYTPPRSAVPTFVPQTGIVQPGVGGAGSNTGVSVGLPEPVPAFAQPQPVLTGTCIV
jgi:hypothetical protein